MDIIGHSSQKQPVLFIGNFHQFMFYIEINDKHFPIACDTYHCKPNHMNKMTENMLPAGMRWSWLREKYAQYFSHSFPLACSPPLPICQR